MAADANLFAQYLRPAKSVNDYMAEMDEADIRREQLAGAKRQNALQALIAQDTMDQRRIAGEDRTRLRDLAGQSGGDTNKLIQLLRGSGSAGLMSQADTLEKGYLDRQKTEAEVGEKKAKTTKEQGGVLDDAMKRYRGALDFIDTPEGAVRWLQAQYADPVLGEHVSRLAPIEQAVARIPRDPQGFQQWRQQSALGMEKFLEQQQKGKDYQLKVQNELIGPDGKPNQTLIGAKQSIAKAGASTVNVNATQEKEEGKAVGKFLGEQYADIQKAGIDAQGKLTRAARMEQLLSRIGTGRFEGAKKEAASIAQGLGITLDPNLGDKEAFEALANQLALEARNPSGGAGMPGAMSDKDREFLTQITPGLSKTPEGNRQIIDTAKRLAKRDAEVAKLAREYRAKRGTLDEGFFEELRQFSEANPLFSGAPAAGAASPSVAVTPFNDAEKERRYQEWKRQQGGGQ